MAGLALLMLGAPTAARAAAGELPLSAAVRAGDRAAVQRLLQEPGAVNAAEPDGTTALHWAVEADDLEVVRALLAAGADAGRASRTRVVPLALAAVNGRPAIVEALLDAGADPNARLTGGQTALMSAARAGFAEIVDLLASRGAAVDAREDALGETAMMWAAAEDHADVIRTLVRRGADVNARSTLLQFPAREFGDGKSGRLTVLPAGGWTPVMYAARQNAGRAVAALVEVGADLDLVDPDGTSPLLVAIINAHYDLAEQLIASGADLDRADASGMAPLYAAVDMHTFGETPGRPAPVASGRLDARDIVERLLAGGADPNARLVEPILVRVHDRGDPALGQGATPLMRAARKADVDLVRLLLRGGADVNAATASGGTALLYIAGLGGAGRFTPFEARQSTEAERLVVTRLLLDAGADVAATDAGLQTALHLAAVDRGEEVLRLLVERGGRLDAVDRQGRTPLDMAKGVGARRREAAERPAIVDLLRALAAQQTPAAAPAESGGPRP